MANIDVIYVVSSPEPMAYVLPSSSSSTISNIFFSDQSQFYVEPPWEGGTKVNINGPGHITKFGCHVCKKLFSLQNQMSYDLEASGTQGLQSLYK